MDMKVIFQKYFYVLAASLEPLVIFKIKYLPNTVHCLDSERGPILEPFFWVLENLLVICVTKIWKSKNHGGFSFFSGTPKEEVSAKEIKQIKRWYKSW